MPLRSLSEVVVGLTVTTQPAAAVPDPTFDRTVNEVEVTLETTAPVKLNRAALFPGVAGVATHVRIFMLCPTLRVCGESWKVIEVPFALADVGAIGEAGVPDSCDCPAEEFPL